MERAFVKASRSRKKFMICHFGTRQMRWSRKLMTFGPLLMNRSVSDIFNNFTRARMGSESIAHEAEIQLLGKKYRE